MVKMAMTVLIPYCDGRAYDHDYWEWWSVSRVPVSVVGGGSAISGCAVSSFAHCAEGMVCLPRLLPPVPRRPRDCLLEQPRPGRRPRQEVSKNTRSSSLSTVPPRPRAVVHRFGRDCSRLITLSGGSIYCFFRFFYSRTMVLPQVPWYIFLLPLCFIPPTIHRNSSTAVVGLSTIPFLCLALVCS